jgi:hypothetical protein
VPAERQIDAISIGIGADLTNLKESLSAAAAYVRGYNIPNKTVYVDVIPRLALTKSGAGASVGDPEFQRQVNLIAQRMRYQVNKIRKDVDTDLSFKATFIPVQASIDSLVVDAQKILDQDQKSAKVTVAIAPDIKSAEAMHATIQSIVKAQGPIKVPIEFIGQWPPTGTPGQGGKGGKGGGGGTGGAPKGKRPKGGGGGGAAEEEPTQATVVAAPVPVAPTPRKARAPKAGAITGAPVKATGTTAVTTPVSSTKVPAQPIVSAGPSKGDEIAALLAQVTPEEMEKEAIKAKRAELEKRGIVFGPKVTSASPSNQMRYKLLEAQGKLLGEGQVIAGITPGSEFARHPERIQRDVLDVLAGKNPGRHLGRYAVPSRGGGRSSRRGYMEPGIGGGAYRLADTRTFAPRNAEELSEAADNILASFINDREFQRQREAAEPGPMDPATQQRFSQAAQFLAPYKQVIESKRSLAEEGKLTEADLSQLNELLQGDPTTIPLATRTKKGKLKSQPWPTMLSNPGDPESEPVTPNLRDALQILRVGDPRRFFKNVGGTKSISRTNEETGQTFFVSPESTALVTGLLSLIGGESANMGPVGGLRGIVSTDTALKERRAASAKRRSEVKHFRALDAMTDDNARKAYILKNFPNLGLNDENVGGFLANAMQNWRPKGRALGGSLFPRMTNSRQTRFVEDALVDAFPNAAVDMSGMLGPNLLPVAERAQSLAAEFPYSAHRLTGVRGVEQGQMARRGIPDTVAAYYDGNGHPDPRLRIADISLNKQKFQDPYFNARQMFAGVPNYPGELPFHPTSFASTGDVFAHEFGHHFDRTHGEFMGAEASRITPISRYGRDNGGVENFAELFQHWTSTGQVPRASWEGSGSAAYDYINPDTGEIAENVNQLLAWWKREKGFEGRLSSLRDLEQSGMQQIGLGGQQMWQAPGPGWIIPHNLIDEIPHKRKGGKINARKRLRDYNAGMNAASRYSERAHQFLGADGEPKWDAMKALEAIWQSKSGGESVGISDMLQLLVNPPASDEARDLGAQVIEAFESAPGAFAQLLTHAEGSEWGEINTSVNPSGRRNTRRYQPDWKGYRTSGADLPSRRRGMNVNQNLWWTRRNWLNSKAFRPPTEPGFDTAKTFELNRLKPSAQDDDFWESVLQSEKTDSRWDPCGNFTWEGAHTYNCPLHPQYKQHLRQSKHPEDFLSETRPGAYGMLGTSKAPFQDYSRNALGGRITKKAAKAEQARLDAVERRISQIENVPVTPRGIDVDLIGAHPSSVQFDRYGERSGSRRQQAWRNWHFRDDQVGMGRVNRDFVGSPIARSDATDLIDVWRDDPETASAYGIDLAHANWLWAPGSMSDFEEQVLSLGKRRPKMNMLGGRTRKGGGGTPPDNLYLVGEAGPELFVPESMGWIIPHHVMDQLPKREGGGSVKGDQMPSSWNMRGAKGFQSVETISRGTIGKGDIQRVFVVNWPQGMGGGGGGGSITGFGTRAGQSTLSLHEKAFSKDIAKNLSTFLKDSLAKADAEPGGPGAPPKRRRGKGGAGGGGGGGGGGGAPEPEAPKIQPGSLADQLRSELQIRRRYALENELPEIGAKITAGQGRAAARALSTGTGEAALYTFGGREQIVARARFAAAFKSYAGEIRGQRKGLEIERNALEAEVARGREAGLGEDSPEITERLAKIENLSGGIHVLGEEEDFATTQARDLAKGITGLVPGLRAMAANTVGIVAGMTLFSTAMGATAVGAEAVERALGPMIERGTGFISTANQMAKASGEQIRQMHGQENAALATTEANAGLTRSIADQIEPSLKQRAITESGNAAFAEQLALINSAAQLNMQMQNAAAGRAIGPLQPAGGIPGLTRATGGFFNTPIGATPSLFEQLGQQAGVSGGQQFIQSLTQSGTNPAFSPISNWLQTVLGANPVKTETEIMAGLPTYQQPQLSQGPLFGYGLNNLFGAQMTPSTFDPFHVTDRDLPEQQLREKEQTKAFRASVEDMTAQAKKAGSSLGFVADASQDMVKASNKALLDIGVDPALVETLGKFKYALADSADSTRKITKAEAQQFGQAVQIGAARIDPELLVRQMTQFQIPAAMRDIERRTQFAIQQQQPAQYALNRIANPLVRNENDPRLLGANQNILKGIPGAGSMFRRDQQEMKGFAASYSTELSHAQDTIDARIAQGKKQLLDWGVPQQLITDLGNVGQAILQIQTNLAQKQTNVAVAGYTNQIRMANRSLRDARDIWRGIHGSVGDTYGLLEGMNIRLSRQLQLLGFGLAQRQINFQQAIAGFVAPGTTPEERAARQKEAKIEAEYAQKQLDLQKQIASNQFQQTGIGASRAVTDLQASIRIMMAERSLVLETNAAQAAIEKLSEERAILLEQASTYLEGAIAKENVFFDVLKTVETETGTLLNKQVSQIEKAWQSAAVSYNRDFLIPTYKNIQALFGAMSSGTAGANGNPGVMSKPNAEGFFGTVSKPTTMLMGEAGTETLAILSNPREVLAQGIAGGSTGDGRPIQIIFNNPVVHEESDIADIVRKVEAVLNRKTSLFGMRRM